MNGLRIGVDPKFVSPICKQLLAGLAKSVTKQILYVNHDETSVVLLRARVGRPRLLTYGRSSRCKTRSLLCPMKILICDSFYVG